MSALPALEVMNEPRLYNNSTTFTMAFLKEVYTLASDVILKASSNGMTVTIHDAFWGPSYWSDYDPSSNSSSDGGSSPDWLELDTHQYYAFAPYENLPRTQILERICNVSKALKQPSSGIPKTVVGEWSLESGRSPFDRLLRFSTESDLDPVSVSPLQGPLPTPAFKTEGYRATSGPGSDFFLKRSSPPTRPRPATSPPRASTSGPGRHKSVLSVLVSCSKSPI